MNGKLIVTLVVELPVTDKTAKDGREITDRIRDAGPAIEEAFAEFFCIPEIDVTLGRVHVKARWQLWSGDPQPSMPAKLLAEG